MKLTTRECGFNLLKSAELKEPQRTYSDNDLKIASAKDTTAQSALWDSASQKGCPSCNVRKDTEREKETEKKAKEMLNFRKSHLSTNTKMLGPMAGYLLPPLITLLGLAFYSPKDPFMLRESRI